jgi:rubredoxin-NAD+ reductase
LLDIDMSSIVILGTGLAGYTLARELRKLDSSTPLHLISRDDGSFYSKPVLSNALAQQKAPGQIALNGAADMERQLAATLSPHVSVSAIDGAAHHLTIGDQTVTYSKLVLAVGADPIRVPLAGDGAADVLSVNDLNDYRQFRKALVGKTQVALLGAGLIGCEFANDLLSAGIGVDVIDPASQPLGRLLPPLAARFLRVTLEAAGVRFHFGTTAQSVARIGSDFSIALANGTRIETGLVLSAIGLRPRIDLARAAGLSVNRGIVTDTHLQTSAADIYALGDCAEVAGLNLPFVMPIMQQARALAKTLSGTPTAVHYPAMPVVVKTPACPTVVCPPPAGVEGQWEETVATDGVRALFHDTAGKLRGFALVGSATKDKQALTKDIPPLLG